MGKNNRWILEKDDMNILTSSYTLDLAGVPTFTLTMYKEFLSRGHKVTVYSPFGGKLENQMHAVNDLEKIETPDVIIAQHTPCAEVLKRIFPNVPTIFYAHGLLPEIEQPPKIPMDYYFVINEFVEKNLVDKGVPLKKIEIIRDFIDTEKFKPEAPISPKLQNVLFISNYKKWKNFKIIEGACKKLGVNLKCCGAPYGRNYKIEEEINSADMIVSWGRGIMEAMSCGRAVLSFDQQLGDGYITPETYFEARKYNFGGLVYKKTFTIYSMAQEMLKYDSRCSNINRELIKMYHEVERGVTQILESIKKLTA